MSSLLTLEDMRKIVAACTFNDWKLTVRLDSGQNVLPRPYLQVSAEEGVCNQTGEPFHWTGRKWFLSPHMTKSEIVTTCFKAIMTAVEHETREQFLYCGSSIFDPHMDVDVLHAIRSTHPGKGLEVRS